MLHFEYINFQKRFTFATEKSESFFMESRLTPLFYLKDAQTCEEKPGITLIRYSFKQNHKHQLKPSKYEI